MLYYKPMKLEDCIKLRDMDASQQIRRGWREVDGRLQLIDIDYFDPDWPNGFETHFNRLADTVRHYGAAYGAFDAQEKLKGFVALNRMDFGTHARYALLDQLFVSRESRGQGIGKALFFKAAETAWGWGADKLYLCAGSAEETIAFYHRLGCVFAQEIHTAFQESDPRDLQMEYVL